MTVYVYHEYTDDQAYGTQIIKIFADKELGLKHLKNRVETDFRKTWNEIPANLYPDDTFEEDYVSINKGDAYSFYILEPQTIIS